MHSSTPVPLNFGMTVLIKTAMDSQITTKIAMDLTLTNMADDCDDADATVFPGATDTWYDGVDQDCAGDNDYDFDGDGQPNQHMAVPIAMTSIHLSRCH